MKGRCVVRCAGPGGWCFTFAGIWAGGGADASSEWSGLRAMLLRDTKQEPWRRRRAAGSRRKHGSRQALRPAAGATGVRGRGRVVRRAARLLRLRHAEWR